MHHEHILGFQKREQKIISGPGRWTDSLRRKGWRAAENLKTFLMSLLKLFPPFPLHNQKKEEIGVKENPQKDFSANLSIANGDKMS